MSAKIRRQSIVSSLVVYCGFLVGLVNVFLFTRNGAFSPEQYGLYNMFIAAGLFLSSLGSLAMPSYLHKFFPFYQNNLTPRDNDQLTWALLMGLAGCVLVGIGGWLFKGVVIQKFGSSSALFVTYYKWLFPFVFGLILYGILEAYGWVLHKSVLTTFIREVEWRLLITVILVLFSAGFIKSFDTFVILYSFTYLILFVTLLGYLFYRKKIHFSFKLSRVTQKLFKKVITFCLFIFSASVVSSLSGIFDTIVIASVMPDGLESAAIFSLAQLMASIVQAPQRGIIAASIPHLSISWKNKNLHSISTIYQRSSINLLLAATMLFVLIVLNYKHAVHTFDLQKEYLLGFVPFIFLGLTRVIDLGTGVNAQIIGTSNFWRFELISNIILLLFILPMSYILTKQFGIIGPSIAGLVSTSIYNFVRIVFLWRKFKLFPFTIKSLYVVGLAITVLAITWCLFNSWNGLTGLFIRTGFALMLFVVGVFLLKPSPDIKPVLDSLLDRIIPGRQKRD